MFPISNILAALPWRLIVAGVAASVLFIGGCQYGENRVTTKWNEEKSVTAQAVAKQVEHVATINAHESTINQEISNEFQENKAAIEADRQHLLVRVPRRLHLNTTGGTSVMSDVPVPTVRADATSADPVSPARQSADNAACEKLAEDAAQTTLMVVKFQQWYQLQTEAFSKYVVGPMD